MSLHGACPDIGQLKAFGLGELTEAVLSEVQSHLSTCPQCAEQLRFLRERESIATARGRAEPRAPGAEQPSSTNTNANPPQPDPAAPLPPELDATVLYANQAAQDDTALQTATDLQAGHRIGDYEIIEEIARGGMGVVFKARHFKLRRLVALKMILMGQLASDDLIRRFMAEARAAARLEHRGIVPVFDIGEHGTLHYFAMQFVDGETLSERLKRGPLKPLQAAKLLRQICSAVQYAHQKGIIHRDIKPGNILITRKGLAKITDFGLAKQLDASMQMTATGDVLGTPSYMAPEQAAGRIRKIKAATDVYALGALLYAMLTGKPPFQARTALATLQQVLTQEPVPPRTLVPELSLDLDTICLKCLQKDPDNRYPSAKALGEELQHFIDGESISARPAGRLEQLVLWCRRESQLAVSIAVSMLLLLSIVVLLAYNWTRQSALKSEIDRLTRLAADKGNPAEQATGDPAAAQKFTANADGSGNRNVDSANVAASTIGDPAAAVAAAPIPKSTSVVYVSARGDVRIHYLNEHIDETLVARGAIPDDVIGLQWLELAKRIALFTQDGLFELDPVEWRADPNRDVAPQRVWKSAIPLAQAAFDPRSRRIAWQTRGGPNKFPEVSVTSLDKNQEQKIGLGYDPAWSFDGQFLFFTGADFQIGRWKNGESQFFKVPAHPSGNLYPVPAPDGKSFLFSMKGSDGNMHLAMMSIDTRTPLQLTRTGTMNSRSSCSPDGRSIAFIRGYSSPCFVVMIDLASGTESILSQDARSISTTWCSIDPPAAGPASQPASAELQRSALRKLLNSRARVFADVDGRGTLEILKADDVAGNVFLIRTVEFHANTATDEALSGLKDLTSVRQLFIKDAAAITPIGAQSINSLRQLERLTILVAKAFNDECLAELKDLPDIQHMTLWGTSLTDAGLIHLNRFPKVEELLLGANALYGDGLAELKPLEKLRKVSLDGTKLKNGALRHLKDLPQVTHWWFSGTPLTDTALNHLRGLKHLKSLNFDETQIGDAGLPALGTLEGLEELSIKRTKVTPAGVQRFQKSYPACKLTFAN